jgi:hypothetical protein
MTPRSNLPYNNAHAATNDAACARVTADKGQMILPSSFDRVLRLAESISLTFLHVAITTSPLPIDDAPPLYFIAIK